jgi:hypothetical protein
MKELLRKNLRGLFILLLAVGYTWFCVEMSFKKGRLSNVPNYDDVSYFASATDLLQSVKDGGRRGLAGFLARDDLHSPYCIGLAALAYWVGGYRDAAPYVANVVLVAAYLCAVAFFARRCRLADFCLVLWIALMLPFASMSVAEFRPDLAWATVTGFAVIFTLTREQFFEGWGSAAAFGSLAGLALLIKPSTFAMTILVLSAAFGGRWLVEFARTNPRQAWRALPRALLAGLGFALLVAGPYFAFYGKTIWNYFYDNSYGKNAAVWVNLYPGSQWKQWTFYAGRDGAGSNLGKLYWAVLPGILGLSVWHFRKSSRAGRLQMAFLWLILAMVYAINSTANIKHIFLGGAFYGTLIFAAAYFAGVMLEPAPDASVRRRGFPSAALAVIALVLTLYYRWPNYSYWGRNKMSDSYVTAWRGVEECLPSCPSPKEILVTQVTVLPDNVKIWYLRRHQHPTVHFCAFVRTLDEFKALLPSADMVIAQDPGTPGSVSYLPAEPLQGGIVRMLREDSAFRLRKLVPIADGKNVYVFVRTALNGAQPGTGG